VAAANLDGDVLQNAVNEFTSQAAIPRRKMKRKTAASSICFASRITKVGCRTQLRKMLLDDSWEVRHRER